MMTPGVGGRRWERQRPVGTRFLTDRQNLSRSAMPTTSTIHPDGIAEVVMDNPPVNALTVGGWFELADILNGLGRDPAARVVVLRAEGRGFNAGVEHKEMRWEERRVGKEVERRGRSRWSPDH